MKADKFTNVLKKYFSDHEDHPLYNFWTKDHFFKVGIPTKEFHDYLHKIMEYIRQKYDIQGDKALDLGCGMGELSVFLALQGWDLVGVDMDEKQLKIAHLLSEENRNVAKFVKADAYNLPLSNEKFDLVICFDVFEHIEDLMPVFKELYRVSKKNSVIFVRFPNKLKLVDDHTGLPLLPLLPKKIWGLYLSVSGNNRKYYQEGLGIYYRTFQNVLKMAIESGFLVDILPPQLMYPPLPRQVRNFTNRFPSLLPSIEPYFHLVFLKGHSIMRLKPSMFASFIENLIWPVNLLVFDFLFKRIAKLKNKVIRWGMRKF